MSGIQQECWQAVRCLIAFEPFLLGFFKLLLVELGNVTRFPVDRFVQQWRRLLLVLHNRAVDLHSGAVITP